MLKENKQISILGCGWLGLPLAKKLILEGYKIKGSTTSVDKLVILADEKIQAYVITLNENSILGEIDHFLENSEILIINIPPKLRGITNENFVSKIEKLIQHIEKSEITKVIFVSSTSVYGNQNEQIEITEEILPNPETESGKQLLQTEQMLLSNTNFKTTVLRFGGLIGEDRHPVKHLVAKQNNDNPDAPINLIHQKDCLGIISKIIKDGIWEEVFNGVTPFHPTRKEYYSKKANELGIIAPVFNEKNEFPFKIISSQKLTTLLKYNFLKKEL